MEIGFLQEIGGLQEDQLVCGSIPMNCMISFQPHCLNVIQFCDVAKMAMSYKKI
jgi:hypothetical protein